MKRFLFLLLLFLSSCHSQHLFVHTQYLNRFDLASSYVGTPDPQLNTPLFGQRLLVQWHFPKGYLEGRELCLEVTIRFTDRSEVVERVSLTARYGYHIYEIKAEEYCSRGEIATYKVDLVEGCEVVESWRHQLWVELIQLHPG